MASVRRNIQNLWNTESIRLLVAEDLVIFGNLVRRYQRIQKFGGAPAVLRRLLVESAYGHCLEIT